MSETIEKTQQKTELDALKQAHDYYATAIQILTQRVKYFHEEFHSVMNTVAFFKHLQQETLNAIYKIEPPAKQDKKVLEMDLTHVKGETPIQPEVELN